MKSMSGNKCLLVGLLLGLTGVSYSLGADPAEDKFHRAFYLEQNEGDFDAAAGLYREIVADSAADKELKSRAKARLAGCREEIASRDLAKLMPESPLVYLELNRPGDRIRVLLEKAGLLADGKPNWPPGSRGVAISPTLINEALGLGGAAVAITGFDPVKQMPTGVLVLHPGSVDVIRGLIETALPSGGTLSEPIRGHTTYNVEEKMLVTLTSRLIVVSTERAQIEGVIRRLEGEERKSLATSDSLAEVLEDRNDSLLFFCVDAQPIISIINAMAGAGGSNHELAVARALFDLDSLRFLSGQLAVGDDSLHLDLALRLDEGHRNLVYNFLRTPPISRATLECIPQGVAGFLAGALNEAPSQPYKPTPARSVPPPVVTALDIGREIFANVTSFAVYALPPDAGPSRDRKGATIPNRDRKGATELPETRKGKPIPDVAAVITVNDPAKSQALWTHMLGIASLVSGATTFAGTAVEIEGVNARSYRFPDNVTIHFAADGRDLFVSTSRSAIGRSLRAKREKASVLTDAAFARSLEQLGADTTKVVVVHPGRCLQIAKLFKRSHHPAESQDTTAWERELEQVAAILSDTSVSLFVNHSTEELRLSVGLIGIPNVGQLISQKMTAEEKASKEREEKVPG